MATQVPAKFSGKPPKTSAHIRSVLKHVHGANAESESALSPGSARDDVGAFVPAAEFRRRRAAKYLAWKLERRGLPCKIVRRGGHWFVHVLSVHLDEALAIYAEHRRDAQRRMQGICVQAEQVRSFSSRLVVGWSLANIACATLGATFALYGFSRTPGGEMWTVFDVFVMLGGALVGLFTWMGLAWMMVRVMQRVRWACTIPIRDDETDLKTDFSWSTLLTTWRSRRNTRSRAASAPSSATSRF